METDRGGPLIARQTTYADWLPDSYRLTVKERKCDQNGPKLERDRHKLVKMTQKVTVILLYKVLKLSVSCPKFGHTGQTNSATVVIYVIQ